MEKKRAQHSMEYLLSVDGAALSDARVKAQFSMDDLAARFKCSKGQVSKWEQEKLVPSPQRIWKMVELFETMRFLRPNGKAELTEEESATIRRELGSRSVISKLDSKLYLTKEAATFLRGLRKVEE